MSNKKKGKDFERFIKKLVISEGGLAVISAGSFGIDLCGEWNKKHFIASLKNIKRGTMPSPEERTELVRAAIRHGFEAYAIYTKSIDGERYYIFYDLIRQNEIKKGIYKK